MVAGAFEYIIWTLRTFINCIQPSKAPSNLLEPLKIMSNLLDRDRHFSLECETSPLSNTDMFKEVRLYKL